AFGVFICFGQSVCDLYRSPLDDRTRSNGLALKRYRELSKGYLAMVRDEAQTLAKHLKDDGVIRIAQPRRGLDQGIEYFLQIEGRPTDDLQNIGGRRLLFQRLG